VKFWPWSMYRSFFQNLGARQILILLFLCCSAPPSLHQRCLRLRPKPWTSWLNAIPVVGIVLVTELRKGEEVLEVHKFVWLAKF
jgi:hypothetical protein